MAKLVCLASESINRLITFYPLLFQFHSNQKATKRLLWFEASFTLIQFQSEEEEEKFKLDFPPSSLDSSENNSVWCDCFQTKQPFNLISENQEAITRADISLPPLNEWKEGLRSWSLKFELLLILFRRRRSHGSSAGKASWNGALKEEQLSWREFDSWLKRKSQGQKILTVPSVGVWGETHVRR